MFIFVNENLSCIFTFSFIFANISPYFTSIHVRLISNSGKSLEDALSKNLAKCKAAFRSCRQNEDATAYYATTCHTSTSNVKQTLTKLLFAQKKVKAVNAVVKSYTDTSSRRKSHRQNPYSDLYKTRYSTRANSTYMISTLTILVSKISTLGTNLI